MKYRYTPDTDIPYDIWYPAGYRILLADTENSRISGLIEEIILSIHKIPKMSP
jgi:hypothetical protein